VAIAEFWTARDAAWDHCTRQPEIKRFKGRLRKINKHNVSYYGMFRYVSINVEKCFFMFDGSTIRQLYIEMWVRNGCPRKDALVKEEGQLDLIKEETVRQGDR
jgi:hypothetical protein